MTAMKKPFPGEQRRRVLLAEDDAAFRRFVGRVLVMSGYEVVEAGSGLEALTLLDGGGAPLDLIVSDIVMPGLGGAGLAREAHRRFPGLRIILISGYADKVEEILAEIGSEADFLRKPFTPDELIAAIEKV